MLWQNVAEGKMKGVINYRLNEGSKNNRSTQTEIKKTERCGVAEADYGIPCFASVERLND